MNGSLPETARGVSTPTLTINPVSPSDRGSYYCVLESSLGVDSVESDRATLQVFCELEITLYKKNYIRRCAHVHSVM